MRKTPAIMFGQLGQSVSIDFPFGRPTSATFTVLRAFIEIDDAANPEFSGAATLDTVNTTLTAAAGPAQADPQQLALASYVGLSTTDAQYLIAANGVSERLNLNEVAATYARTRLALQYDYPIGATVLSTRLTAAIDDTFIQNISKISDLSDTYPDYRVKWTIIYAGKTYILYSFFDVVRTPARHSVEIADVNDRAPGLAYSLPVEYRSEDGRPLIEAAWRAVRAHLQAMNIAVDAIREDEVIDELVILRSLRVLAEGGWMPPAFKDLRLYLELVTKNYDTFFTQHFAASLKHRLDYQLGPLTKSNAIPALLQPWWAK